jgi:hypothetical protein
VSETVKLVIEQRKELLARGGVAALGALEDHLHRGGRFLAHAAAC